MQRMRGYCDAEESVIDTDGHRASVRRIGVMIHGALSMTDDRRGDCRRRGWRYPYTRQLLRPMRFVRQPISPSDIETAVRA